MMRAVEYSEDQLARMPDYQRRACESLMVGVRAKMVEWGCSFALAAFLMALEDEVAGKADWCED